MIKIMHVPFNYHIHFLSYLTKCHIWLSNQKGHFT
jgi:hypothetical protein